MNHTLRTVIFRQIITINLMIQVAAAYHTVRGVGDFTSLHIREVALCCT